MSFFIDLKTLDCVFSFSNKKGDPWEKKGAAACPSVVGCSAHPSQVANLSPLLCFFLSKSSSYGPVRLVEYGGIWRNL